MQWNIFIVPTAKNKKCFKILYKFFGLVIFLVSIFSYPALYLFGGEAYLGFHHLIAIIGLISIIYGYSMISTLGIWITEKTYLSAVITSIALAFGFY